MKLRSGHTRLGVWDAVLVYKVFVNPQCRPDRARNCAALWSGSWTPDIQPHQPSLFASTASDIRPPTHRKVKASYWHCAFEECNCAYVVVPPFCSRRDEGDAVELFTEATPTPPTPVRACDSELPRCEGVGGVYVLRMVEFGDLEIGDLLLRLNVLHSSSSAPLPPEE